MSDNLSFDVRLSVPVAEAIEQLREALKAEGFGILTQVDVEATLKQKINADFRPYMILGVCNPVLAKRALEIDPRVGLFLPCTVTVQEMDGQTLVSIFNPDAMLGFEDFATSAIAAEVAPQAKARLERVAAALASAE
ncbi:MAG: DUF302 domain-containing protein [Anaerolineaceae bacterium]|nr:DUF302 domain-containing protein [Anaerolineaceae bacterium]